MILEDKTDYKSIRLASLSLHHKLKSFVLAISISTSLFAGKEIVRASDDVCLGSSIEIENSNIGLGEIVWVPEIYIKDIEVLLGEEKEALTKKDLIRLNSFNLVISDNSSLDWLKYCENLKKINIFIDEGNDSDVLKSLAALNDLENLEEIYLGTISNLVLTKDNSTFLSKLESLKKLTVDGFSVEKGVLEGLNNLESLSLYLSSKGIHVVHIDVDYKKLTFLNELIFIKARPYDIAIWFTSDDYNALIQNNVKVMATEDGKIEKIIEINKKLDRIISSFELSDETLEKSKLDKALSYVLEKLEYDDDVSSMSSDEIDFREINEKFYLDGQLYGALEGGSAVCGNYAALLSALLNRLGINSYYLANYDHAWNLVEIDGNNYYVDPTLLDNSSLCIKKIGIFIDDTGLHFCKYIEKNAVEVINDGMGEVFDYYMKDPTKANYVGYAEIISGSKKNVESVVEYKYKYRNK